MPSTSVLLLLAKATVVLVLAMGIARLLQRASAGARHLVWLAALGALVLVPALARWAPLRLAVLPAAAGATNAAPSTPPAVIPTLPAPRPDARTSTGSTSSAAGPQSALGTSPSAGASPSLGALDARALVPAALALWAAVAFAVGASLAGSWLAVRRLVRRARPLDAPDWRGPLYEVADRLGLDEPPRLLRSAEARMPFACGLRRPTVVLPAACDGWTLDRRRAVLLHELAHVRRRDLAGHTLARLVCAAYWFHPLVWAAARRLRAESERACDDLALASGARAADYAEHLLDIVTSVRRDATPAAALAMARRAEFEGRMLDILDPERPRATPSRRQAAALVGLLAGITVVVGAAAPVPAADAAPRVRPVAASADARVPESRPESRPEPRAAALSAVDTTAPTPVPRVAPGTAGDATAAASGRAAARASSAAAAGGGLDTGAGVNGNARVDVRVASAVEAVVSAAVNAAANAGVGADARVPNGAGRPAAAPPAGAPAGASDGPDGLARFSRTVAASALRALVRGGQPPAGGQGGDERADLLARVLRADTSASVRRVAAWGLAEYAERPAAAAALAAALRSDASAAVRETAAWALAEAGRGAEARDALTAALRRDADARVRARAAWALGSLGDRGAADALVAALADPGDHVRARAAWALGSVGLRQAPRPLVALLGDQDAGVRKLAAWALYSIEDPAAVPALQAAMRAERDPGLQVAYVRALAALGEQSVDALRPLLESPDARVRTAAVRALAGGRAGEPWPWPWPEPRPYP